MERSIYKSLIFFAILYSIQEGHAQQHDRHWVGNTTYFWDSLYRHVTMAFDGDSISYEVRQPDPETVSLYESVAMSDVAGNLQFYTNGNVVVSWDGQIMESGKGFNEGSAYSDFGNWPGEPDTVYNNVYLPYTYQLIPDGYEEGMYYMLHSFTTLEDFMPCSVLAAPKMQLSKIDMNANGGKGKVVYKNRYLDEGLMHATFAMVQHGNGQDWWLVRRSVDGLYFRSTLLQRDSVLLTVESTMPGLSSDWFDCWDLIMTAQNLIEVSQDGSMLLDNYGLGHAKLMGFDRCSGEVSLLDTFSLGYTYLEYNGGEGYASVNTFAFSPSGRYLYAVGWAGFVQYDLWAADILASRVELGGVPWGMDDFQNVLTSNPGGYGPFCPGPDGKLYSLYETAHNVIEYPDEPGEASGICVAADNPPSCLGSPHYLFSTPHPHYRLGPLAGSGCDTILSSTKRPVANAGYGVSAWPTVTSGPVEVSISLPGYGSHVTAEVQVVDMLGRVIERHRFPPYAYLHMLDMSGWAAGLYNVVLLENGRPKAGARLVVGR